MRLVRTAPLVMAIGVLGGIYNPTLSRAEALPEGSPLRGAAAPRAEARCSSEGDTVWLDGARVWPARGSGHPRIVTPLLWSGAGDAIAFLAQRGEKSLEIVVLVLDRGAITPLSWPVPAAALPARVVTWVGPTKVAIGPTAFAPKAAVSFVKTR
jgi:hypothetical protein